MTAWNYRFKSTIHWVIVWYISMCLTYTVNELYDEHDFTEKSLLNGWMVESRMMSHTSIILVWLVSWAILIHFVEKNLLVEWCTEYKHFFSWKIWGKIWGNQTRAMTPHLQALPAILQRFQVGWQIRNRCSADSFRPNLDMIDKASLKKLCSFKDPCIVHTPTFRTINFSI